MKLDPCHALDNVLDGSLESASDLFIYHKPDVLLVDVLLSGL